ncbi:hypothetical protein GCM10023082_28170 [Streptomyces tremellae]|uniref:N-acetyltransferase domain-containing protein n=1 Tax=Streptomyces tremellae TaxID=1124239 RepID=A0ABP7F217_9ACTN
MAGRGGRACQFIAEAPDGTWWGALTVLVEEAGSLDFLNTVIKQRQGHVVSVFVRPEQRGTGLIGALVDAGLAWAWSWDDPPLELVRLYVHEENTRARAAYARMGFVPTGLEIPFAPDPSAQELEMALERPRR